MNSIERTGVFATKEETEKMIRFASERRNVPLVKIGRGWLPDDAELDILNAIDALAVSHGLPKPCRVDATEADDLDDIDHYGMIGTGEFTRRPGQKVEP